MVQQLKYLFKVAATSGIVARECRDKEDDMQVRLRAMWFVASVLVVSASGFAQVGPAGRPEGAELAPPAAGPTTEVPLVRQDMSDCTNSNVTAKDPSLIGGTV